MRALVRAVRGWLCRRCCDVAFAVLRAPILARSPGGRLEGAYRRRAWARAWRNAARVLGGLP